MDMQKLRIDMTKAIVVVLAIMMLGIIALIGVGTVNAQDTANQTGAGVVFINDSNQIKYVNPTTGDSWTYDINGTNVSAVAYDQYTDTVVSFWGGNDGDDKIVVREHNVTDGAVVSNTNITFTYDTMLTQAVSVNSDVYFYTETNNTVYLNNYDTSASVSETVANYSTSGGMPELYTAGNTVVSVKRSMGLVDYIDDEETVTRIKNDYMYYAVGLNTEGIFGDEGFIGDVYIYTQTTPDGVERYAINTTNVTGIDASDGSRLYGLKVYNNKMVGLYGRTGSSTADAGNMALISMTETNETKNNATVMDVNVIEIFDMRPNTTNDLQRQYIYGIGTNQSYTYTIGYNDVVNSTYGTYNGSTVRYETIDKPYLNRNMPIRMVGYDAVKSSTDGGLIGEPWWWQWLQLLIKYWWLILVLIVLLALSQSQ